MARAECVVAADAKQVDHVGFVPVLVDRRANHLKTQTHCGGNRPQRAGHSPVITVPDSEPWWRASEHEGQRKVPSPPIVGTLSSRRQAATGSSVRLVMWLRRDPLRTSGRCPKRNVRPVPEAVPCLREWLVVPSSARWAVLLLARPYFRRLGLQRCVTRPPVIPWKSAVVLMTRGVGWPSRRGQDRLPWNSIVLSGQDFIYAQRIVESGERR